LRHINVSAGVVNPDRLRYSQKDVFADLVESDPDFIADFNFDHFKLIFERLEMIIVVEFYTKNHTN